MTRLEILLKSKQNIFTTDDLMVLWKVSNRREIIESVKDYVRRQRLFPLRRGIYLLTREYNKNELAQKLISPSYISYYTALAIHGIIFQKYSEIHSFSPYSKTFVIDEQKYVFHMMSQEILHIQDGIMNFENYTIATPERAICDSLNLNKTIAFDNLRNVNIEKLESVSKIYKNKRLEADVKKLIDQIKNAQ